MRFFHSIFIISIFLSIVNCKGFYQDVPDIFELDSSNFDEIILNTNYTSIVEFYAPWCGQCQKLKSTYKKVGKASQDLYQVAAVNCDDAINKPICSKYRIDSYPTMIIFRPPKYDAIDHEKNLKESDGLKFATEIYKGQRSLSAIVEFVLSRIKNYVKKLHNFDQINKYIQGRTKTNKSKILLLTDKNKPTPLIKSIAIDYLSSFETAYITIKKNEKDEIFDFFKIDKDIAKLPQIIIIDTKDNPNEKEEIIVYDGDLNKVALSHYLSNFATPLEGPASKRMDLLNKHKNINNSQNNKKDKNKKKKNSKNTANAHDEL